MNNDPQRAYDYLEHIREAIERIASYTEDRSEVAFLTDRMLQDAVIRNIEIIGEASNNILKRYPEFVAAHPDLPLTSAYQMRNAVAHGYFRVNMQVVWDTIETSLPELYGRISSVLEGLSESENDDADDMRP